MFKIYVVLVGLSLVVPDKGPNPTGVTAILVDAANRPDVFNKPGEPHFAQLNLRTGASAVTLPAGFRLELSKRCKSNCRPNLTLAKANQPDLVMLSGGKDNGVRAGCLKLDNGASCGDDASRDLVKGRVRLVGPWEARAASTCDDDVPARNVDAVDWKYFQTNATNELRVPHPPAPTQALGNTYIFETASEPGENEYAGADIELKVNGMVYPISVSLKADCLRLNPAFENCAILELRNLPHHGETVKPGEQRPEDRHFAVLYQLMKSPPPKPWVPVAQGVFCKDSFTLQPKGPREVPGNRCGGGGG